MRPHYVYPPPTANVPALTPRARGAILRTVRRHPIATVICLMAAPGLLGFHGGFLDRMGVSAALLFALCIGFRFIRALGQPFQDLHDIAEAARKRR